MAYVQIDDAELAQLRRDATTGRFAEGLYNDPHVGDALRELIKKAKPDLKIPDYDLKREVFARLDSDKEAREKADKEVAEKAENDKLSKAIDDAVGKYNLTDKGRDRVMEMMQQGQIASPDHAAELLAARAQMSADQSPGHDGLWRHTQAADFVDIAKNPESWARGEIFKSLTQPAFGGQTR